MYNFFLTSAFEPTNGDHDNIETGSETASVREAAKFILSLKNTIPGTQIRVHTPEGPATSMPFALGSIRRGLEAHMKNYRLEVIPPKSAPKKTQ